MELLVLSDYGLNEELKLKNPSKSDIISTMKSINWNLFHQVLLSKNGSDWIEVGGNLAEDGLSVMYEKNNEQFVIDNPPSNIEQLTEILLSYLNNDGKLYKKYNFTGEENSSKPKWNEKQFLEDFIKEGTNKSFETNKNEKYELLEIIQLFLLAPYYFIIGSYRFKSFKRLKEEKYNQKFKQKIIVYLLSFLTWSLFISYSINKKEQEWLDEIDKIDISDWGKKHGYDK